MHRDALAGSLGWGFGCCFLFLFWWFVCLGGLCFLCVCLLVVFACLFVCVSLLVVLVLFGFVWVGVFLGFLCLRNLVLHGRHLIVN